MRFVACGGVQADVARQPRLRGARQLKGCCVAALPAEEPTNRSMAFDPQEEREFQQRLLALAGIGPAAGGAAGPEGAAADGEEAEYASEEEEDEVDVDDLSYEQAWSGCGWRRCTSDAGCPCAAVPAATVVRLDCTPTSLRIEPCRAPRLQLTALGEAVGTVSKGIPAAEIEALPQQVQTAGCGTAAVRACLPRATRAVSLAAAMHVCLHSLLSFGASSSRPVCCRHHPPPRGRRTTRWQAPQRAARSSAPSAGACAWAGVGGCLGSLQLLHCVYAGTCVLQVCYAWDKWTTLRCNPRFHSLLLPVLPQHGV